MSITLPSRLFLVAALAVGLTPLLGSSVNVVPAAAAGATVDSVQPCAGAGRPPLKWPHVTLIVFENKPLPRIIGNTADAPYLNTIAGKCGYSQNTRALSTTSLANYIALTSGYTGCEAATRSGVCTQEAEITANRDPSVWPQASSSIFELMDRATPGSAIEWAEDSQGNCYTGGEGLFTVSHTPFPYYTRTKALCAKYAKPFPARKRDVLSARFNLVIPNKEHIMHWVPQSDVSQRIRSGDVWLSNFLPPLLDSRRYRNGNSAILITWDEGNNSNFVVPLIVVTPYTQVGGMSSVRYSHYSTLKGIQLMLGQTKLLGHAADTTVQSIRADAAFRLK